MFVTTSCKCDDLEFEPGAESCLDGEDVDRGLGFLRTRPRRTYLFLRSVTNVIGWNTETLKVTFRLVPPESEIVSKANKISFARDRLVVAFESGVLHVERQ